MDVLAGRKTVGAVTGEVLVNGRPKQQATWARVLGCVPRRQSVPSTPFCVSCVALLAPLLAQHICPAL